jgi:hypothetical protein
LLQNCPLFQASALYLNLNTNTASRDTHPKAIPLMASITMEEPFKGWKPYGNRRNFSDFKLICKNNVYYTHRVTLAASSLFFKVAFKPKFKPKFKVFYLYYYDFTPSRRLNRTEARFH